LVRAEVLNPVARILCVDDEDVILDSFRKILVPAGFSVDTVRTGQDALGLIQTHAYDFVFTDLRMPAMDGLDVVKSVKHLRPDIDVVVITGFGTVETAVECMKFGALDYVQKPFSETELLEFTRRVIIRRQDRIQQQLQPVIEVLHQADPERVHAQGFSIPGGVLIAPGHSWVCLLPNGTLRVGLDDFARKLIGRVETVDFPQVGTTVQAGQPLFAVRQKGRVARFPAPVSGRISRLNPALRLTGSGLEVTPYGRHWICEMESETLDTELPALKIGKAAVALFQEDLTKARVFLQELTRKESAARLPDQPISIGEMEQLTDAQWAQATAQFFGGAKPADR
jgi:CheY-like chemotaxis protein